MLERKVYNSWAYTPDANEKAKINREIFNEIKDLAIVKRIGNGYANNIFSVVEKTERKLSDDEKALIADSGNLCFGYRKLGDSFVIYTD